MREIRTSGSEEGSEVKAPFLPLSSPFSPAPKPIRTALLFRLPGGGGLVTGTALVRTGQPLLTAEKDFFYANHPRTPFCI